MVLEPALETAPWPPLARPMWTADGSVQDEFTPVLPFRPVCLEKQPQRRIRARLSPRQAEMAEIGGAGIGLGTWGPEGITSASVTERPSTTAQWDRPMTSKRAVICYPVNQPRRAGLAPARPVARETAISASGRLACGHDPVPVRRLRICPPLNSALVPRHCPNNPWR